MPIFLPDTERALAVALWLAKRLDPSQTWEALLGGVLVKADMYVLPHRRPGIIDAAQKL